MNKKNTIIKEALKMTLDNSPSENLSKMMERAEKNIDLMSKMPSIKKMDKQINVPDIKSKIKEHKIKIDKPKIKTPKPEKMKMPKMKTSTKGFGSSKLSREKIKKIAKKMFRNYIEDTR